MKTTEKIRIKRRQQNRKNQTQSLLFIASYILLDTKGLETGTSRRIFVNQQRPGKGRGKGQWAVGESSIVCGVGPELMRVCVADNSR
jgi:hypothetical protein